MQRALLERQANHIEMVLASQKVPGRVFAMTVAPRVVRFSLMTGLGTKVAKVSALAEEIALALGVATVRIARANGSIEVEVPRSQPGKVELTKLCNDLKTVPPCTAALGLDETGAPLLLRLPSPDVAHVLIAGRTGSGKTVLMRTLLLTLAMFNEPRAVQIVLIDPKGRGLGPLAEMPHRLGPLTRGIEEAVEVLERLVVEMERRDRHQIREPRLVVAIDEVAELALAGGQPILDALARLTQRGREAGVHVVACTQKPTANVLGSPEEAKIATGIAGSGAEKLTGQGDFLLVTQGQCLRFQAAWVDARTLAQLVKRVQVSHAPRLLLEATGTEGDPGNGRLQRLGGRLRLIK